MKKLISLLLALVMALSLVACGSKDGKKNDESVELTVFAAASLTESLTAIGDKYMDENKNVRISFNSDSSGKLLTQIEEGAVCDLFISAAPKQMNALDGSLKDNSEKNPKGQDLLVAGSRIDLLENKVVLAVAEGTVDCGIIYASDAYSAKLTVAAEATADMCGQVIYPATVLNTSTHQDAAAAFLQYLQGAEASAEFEKVLFTPLSK